MKIPHVLFAGSLLFSARVALAEDVDVDAPPADEAPPPVAAPPAPDDGDVDVDVVVVEEPPPEDGWEWFDFLGMEDRAGAFGGLMGEVKVGLSGGDFTEDNLQARSSAGFGWDVRTVFGADTFFGLEGAYVGSSRGVEDVPGAGSDTLLVSNGLEGDLRLALPLRITEMVDVRPFVFGGLGWQYMTFWGDGTVDGTDGPGDNVMTLPAGGGLDFGIGPLNVEARGTYRHAVGSDIFGEADADFDEPNAVHTYAFGGAIGLEF